MSLSGRPVIALSLQSAISNFTTKISTGLSLNFFSAKRESGLSCFALDSVVSEDEDGDDDNDGDSAPPGDGAHRRAPTGAPTGTAMTAGGAITPTAAMVMFYMPAEREDDGEPSSEEEGAETQ